MVELYKVDSLLSLVTQLEAHMIQSNKVEVQSNKVESIRDKSDGRCSIQLLHFTEKVSCTMTTVHFRTRVVKKVFENLNLNKTTRTRALC